MPSHDELYLDFMTQPASAGVSFNNRIYLACPRFQNNRDPNDPAGDTSTMYWLSVVKARVQGTVIEQESETQLSKYFGDTTNTVPTNPAACVHQGTLYVFWQEKGVICYRETADGDKWGDQKTTQSAMVDPDASQIAAVSTGDALLVFAPSGGKLDVATCIDGSWHHEIRPDWINARGIAACTFMNKEDPDAVNIMFGMVTTHANIMTGRYGWKNGKLALQETVDHSLPNSNTLALVQGSTVGGSSGNIVQLFSCDSTARRKREYAVSDHKWQPVQALEGEYVSTNLTGNLAAFQHFQPSSDGALNQDVWLLFIYNGWTGASTYAARWGSDQLKLVKTHDPHDVDESHKELWCLVGVVEGPPPYVLNGKTFFEKVSEVAFKYSERDETTTRVETSVGAYISVGGKGGNPGVVGFGCGISGEFANTAETKTTDTVTIGLVKFPQPQVNDAIEIYLKPTVLRKDYEVQDYKGNSLDVHVHVFSVVQWSPDYFPRDLEEWPRNPANNEKLKTGEIHTWMSRWGGLPPCADDSDGAYVNRTVTWVQASEANFGFEKAAMTMDSDRGKVTINFSLGTKDIFDIGANYSASLTTSHQTTVGQNIGFSLRYPAPDSKEPMGVTKVGLRVLLIKPSEDRVQECYWIPKDRMDQRPWCLAWSVDCVEYQNGRLIGSAPRADEVASL